MRDGQKTEAELREEINTLHSRIARLEQAERENIKKRNNTSNHLFQTIFNNAADGILLADVETKKFHMANTRLCRMLGYSPEEIKNLGVGDIHPEKDLPNVIEYFDKQVRGESSLAKDIPVTRKDGSIFYTDINSLPIKLDGTKYLMGIFRDISDRKKAEDALKQSEETFRLVMEATNDALWDWNMVTDEVYRNPRHATMLGYRPHELTASQDEWEKRIHPDDRSSVFKIIEEHKKSGKTDPFKTEYRLKTKKGDYIWILGRGKIVSFTHDGTPLRMIGTNIDITEHKKAEEKLRKSEERYRSVVEGTPFLLCSFLPRGEIIFVNSTYCEYFGKTSEELIGKNLTSLIPENERKTVLDNIMLLTADNPKITHEHQVIAPDGRVRWQRWTNQGIFNEQSKAVFYQSFGEDITDHKNAEQALKESEEHFRMLAERMNDGLSHVDENGILVYVNRRCAEMLGYTQDEMIGNHWSSFYADDSRAIVAEQLILRRKGISEPYEITNTRKDGRKFHIYLSPQPIFDKDGQFKGSFAIMTDITRFKEMEEELFKEKSRLQSILEVMDNYLTIRDLDYTITYQNESATRLLGNKTGEKCYRAYENIDRICDGCPVELAYKDGKSHISEREVMLPSGEIRYLENIANPMRDASGKIFACLEVSTDVTERKKSADALHESEEKYRTLVESTGETFVTIDENGTYLFMNRTAAKRLGVDPENYTGKTMWDLFPKQYADSQAADVRKVIKTEQGMNRFIVTEIQGKQRWYNVTIEPLRNAAGNVIAAMVLARDITEFKKAEQELDKYRQEMARTEQLASVGTLSAIAAHELTQPLTVIRLLIENALKKLKTSSSSKIVAEKLKESLTEVTNITSVVNRLRSFARKSSGKILMEVNLGNIASKIVNMLNESAQQADFNILLEGMEKLPHIYSNDKDMEQLFFSLVDNAMQANQDQKNRKLVITCAVKGEFVELRFRDNCGGIPPQNLDRIFEPFFTTKSDGKGTGLGLCIVKDIVSRSGGKIHVESKFGKGTTFFITLPINDDEM